MHRDFAGAQQMTDDSTLRSKAREAIQARRLPDRLRDRTWGGPGAGASCPVCGERLKHDEPEFELEFDRDDGDRGPDNYHIHILCFAVWELEFQTLGGARRTVSANGPALPRTAGEVWGSGSGKPASGGILPEVSTDGTILGYDLDTSRGGPR
jgi:hypothetical protein